MKTKLSKDEIIHAVNKALNNDQDSIKAASPELLECLEEVLKVLDTPETAEFCVAHGLDTWLFDARSAVAKAHGELDHEALAEAAVKYERGES